MATSEQYFKLKKLLEELEKIKGRHTELVSVYVPVGYGLLEIMNMLRQEVSLTQNVKSKAVRNNVTAALEKVLQHLKLYKKTPENGLAIFCGNISEQEGVSDIKIWAVEPPEPISAKLYWCDQKFELHPLLNQVKEKEVYGLVTMDTKEATVGLLKGKSIEVLWHKESIVPGKQIKGGQCLAPDTLVQLEDGDIIEIGEVHNPHHIFGADIKSFLPVSSKVNGKWENKKTLYKIITKNPRFELQASADHIFFVRTQDGITESPLAKIKIGDTLLIPEKLKTAGQVQPIDESEKYIWLALKKSGSYIIRAKRKSLDLSQEDLANKLNRHQTDISRLESRPCNFQREFVAKVLRVLGIEEEEFIHKYCSQAFDVKIPKKITKGFAQFLGYFVGDGNFDENKLSFSEGDKKTATFYSELMSSVFGTRASVRYRKDKNYWIIRLYSLPIVRTIKKEFPEITDALTTRIPSKILRSPKTVLAAFLRGLFDADGYVSNGRVAIGINNKKLAQMIQFTLLRFGILSSFLEYDAKRNPYSKRHRFTVHLVDKESIMIFGREIGFSSPAKNSRLKKAMAKHSKTSYSRKILPVGSQIKKVLEIEDIVLRELRAPNFFNNRREISKVAFKRLLSRIKDKEVRKRLAKLLDYGLLPVKVLGIETIGSHKTVDISVANSNFFANGILVHNSAARYQRVREGLVNDWYKEVAETMKSSFAGHEIKGIILGGPGISKEDFFNQDYLETNLKKNVLGIVNVGYTNQDGMEELVNKSSVLLKEAKVSKEKELVTKFFNELRKDSGKVVYGFYQVKKAIEIGAVEKILISEKTDWVEAEYQCSCGSAEKRLVKESEKSSQICPKCGKKMSLIGEADALDAIEDLAKSYGTSIEIISRETMEGEQLYQLGGIGAFLRYKL